MIDAGQSEIPLFEIGLYSGSSVGDQGQFGTDPDADPDPRIRTSD
jgi:hypothetical protein